MRRTLLIFMVCLFSTAILFAQPTGEIQKLLAEGNAGGDYFGYSVDMDGDYAIVGAYQDDITASNTGSAYIYHFNGSGWDQVGKLTASDAAADDWFGYSVSISGDVAVVGANQDDDMGANSGSVYVFNNNSGIWSQVAKLTASNGQANDNLGCSVAIEGDYIIAGAKNDDNLGQNSGSAFVYHYSAGVWVQEAILIASDGTLYDYLGTSVDISGNYAIVGTYLKDGIGADSGAAYLYQNNSGVWSQVQKLVPADLAAGDQFGISVSISGDYAIVGENYDADFGNRSGSAYIYYNNAGSWEENLKINAPDANEYDEFGVSVSIKGDNLIVGASRENNTGVACGSSYIFHNNAGTWSYEQKITPVGGVSNLYFASAVAISGENCISGAYANQTYGSYTGISYFYNRSEGGLNNWGETGRVLPNDGSHDNLLGSAVSVSGDYAFVGAKSDDDNGASTGSVFVYHNTGTEWEQIHRFLASDANAGDNFGVSVSVSGDYAIVGASGDDDKGSGSGSAYIFKNTSGVWAQYAKLTAGDGAADDNFGFSVSIDGDYAIIGAYGDDDVALNSGSVYVFKNNAGVWSQYSKHTGSTQAASDYFGYSVAVSGDYFVAGAYNDDNFGSNSGSAFIFKNTAGVWAQDAFITASDAAASDYFGKSTAVSGNYVVIGAAGNDDNGSSSGSAYVFWNNAGVWSQLSKLNASDAAAGDYFGSSVSVSGSNVFIGAHLDDNLDYSVGAAYLYSINAGVVSQTNKFIPSDKLTYGAFAQAVCIDGNIAIAGAPGNSTNGINSGAAFVFGMIPPQITQNPVDLSAACIGVNEQFFVSGNGIVDYQWQISTDGGGNWSDITEAAPYSGSQTAGLSVTISSGLNNNLYRCVCSNTLGDVTSESAEIIIETESPVISSTYNDQTVNANSSCQALLPDYTGSLTATDNCDLSLSITQSPVSGTTISGATNPVTLTATDDAGNYSQVSFNVAVVDNTNPVITSVHNEQTLSGNASCQANLPSYVSSLIATDNCDTGLTVTQSPVAGTIVSGSSNTVTLTATDDNGNFVQVSFNVLVEDDTNPTITSTHNDQIISANALCQALLPDYTSTLTATDYCDADLTVTQNPVPGTTVSGDINTITLRVTDDAGNYSEVSFNLAVVDNSNPVITSVHSDQTLNADASCQTILPDYTSSLTASDNCDATLTVTQTPVSGSMISGSINTVTLRATDDNSNYAEVSFNVSVSDITNPVITSVHPNQTVIADQDCLSVMPDYTGSVVATDNCDSDLTITQTPAGGTIISSVNNLVVLRAADDAGNYAQVSFYVAIVDNTAPVITSVHNDQVLSDESNCEASLPDYTVDVVASDNCEPFLVISQFPVAGTMISGSNNTVTLSVADNVGNTSQVNFNVAVQDNSNPVITSVHNDQTLEAVADCEAALPDYTSYVIASDNCDSDLVITQSPIAGTLVSGASNNVTLTVADGTGNFAQVSFNVVVTDNSGPQITSVHNDQTLEVNTDCEAFLPDFTGSITATDNCSTNISYSQSPVAGTQISGAVNVVTLTAEDEGGNVSQLMFNVEVVDIINPTIVCAENQVINLAEGQNVYTVSGNEFNPVSTEDNCGVASVENDFNNSNTLAGAELPVGTTTIVWTVTDNVGNTETCSTDFTVNIFVGNTDLTEAEILIYPNPTGGILTVENAENYKMELTDMSGRIITGYDKISDVNIKLDLTGLPGGIYMLKLSNDSRSVVERIVVE